MVPKYFLQDSFLKLMILTQNEERLRLIINQWKTNVYALLPFISDTILHLDHP
jgi:hypothetical protein